MATAMQQQTELPPLKGFYRTPFGIYIADHKSPSEKTWPETAEYIQRDGSILIPNSYWSYVATLTKEGIEAIENPDIRRETQEAQRLMLEYPAQFVNLMVIGNNILVEPYGLGVKVLPEKLRKGPIEVYDHDASKIVVGSPQQRYFNAKLWVDESAKEDDIRFAGRSGGWGVGGRRDDVDLSYGLRGSDPSVAGLGFRPESNQAYFDVNGALEELARAEQSIQNARNALR